MNDFELSRHVGLTEAALPGYGTMTVRAALVRGARLRVAVDTLLAPADMAPFGAADLVIYTHSDWDHCWGTAAFPGAPVIGHRTAHKRLTAPGATEELAAFQAEHPKRFAGSAVIPPSILLASELAIDAGGLTLCLHHVPGHTADSVLVHIPELETLLAGDFAEGPIPSLNEPGYIRGWPTLLRRWAGAAVRTVVPGHGEIGGPDLLVRNAVYIEELVGQAEDLLRRGCSPEEIRAGIPIEPLLPDVDRYAPYYRKAHLSNISAVLAELT